MALSTTAELLAYLQDELEDSNPSAAQQTKYINDMDRAHKAIVSGGGELNLDEKGKQIQIPYIFPWAVEADPILVNTVAPIESGTVSVTQGSTSLTFSGSITPDVAGYHFKIKGTDTVYKIATHGGSSASATLDKAYVDSNNTAADYTLFKLDYTFAPSSGSLLIPADHIRTYNPYGRMSISSRAELENQYPLYQINEREPKLAGLIRQTTSGLTVRLSHYPSDIQRMELYYVAVPTALSSGGADPILPAHHRIIVPHLAAYYIMRRRDDDRALSHLQTAQRLFKAMKEEAQQLYAGNDEMFAVVMPWL